MKKYMGGIRTAECVRQRCQMVEDCWVWVGACNSFGHPQAWFSDLKAVTTVRMGLYRMKHGTKPPGNLRFKCMCDEPSCVNPAHTALRTHASMIKGTRRNPGLHVAKLTLISRGKSKLNEQIVQEIRASNETSVAIAARYGISQAQAHRILSYQAWKPLAVSGHFTP